MAWFPDTAGEPTQNRADEGEADRRARPVVFPDRMGLSATNYLEVYDPHGSLAQRIGA